MLRINKLLNINSPWLHVVILAALATPYFINLGVSSLWEGSEVFYAETPREMIESGDWLSPQFNYEPRVNKPPLTYWVVVGSYKIFGINEFAARLPGAFAAFGVMLFSWGAARIRYGPRAALIAAAVAATTPRIFILERRLPLDILLLFFLTGTLFFLLRALEKNCASSWRCTYAFAALGFMTKGPIAAIIPAGALFIWMLYSGRIRHLSAIRLPECIAIFLCITLPWYILSYLSRGWEYIAQFFLVDNLSRYASETVGPVRGFFYYIPIWFSDFFPWSFIGLAALISLHKTVRLRLKESYFGLPFFWCVLIFLIFSLSKSKQEHYIAPIFPAAAVLVAGMFAGFSQRDKAVSSTAPSDGQIGGFRHWRRIFGALAFLLFLMAFILPVILDILLPGVSAAMRLGPSVVLIVGAVLTAGNAIRGNFNSAFASLVFSLWIIFVSGSLIYVPALEKFRPVRDFCTIIENQVRSGMPEEYAMEAGYFRTSLPSMTFYLRHRIFEEYDYEEMKLRFLSGRRVFCILDGSDYDWFVKQNTQLFVLDRRERISIRFGQLFGDGSTPVRELILVSNLPPD